MTAAEVEPAWIESDVWQRPDWAALDVGPRLLWLRAVSMSAIDRRAFVSRADLAAWAEPGIDKPECAGRLVAAGFWVPVEGGWEIVGEGELFGYDDPEEGDQ
jgi:hypothetical protein